jgi:hypothetical protein
MGNASNVKPSAEAVLAEYSALRAEIIQMEQTQSNIFALQLTAAAVIFSFSLSNASRTGFLLILPVVSYALSRRYLLTNEVMKRLSDYITEQLSPKVQGGFSWEEWNRRQASNRRAFGRFRLIVYASRWLGPVPLIFVWISIAALVWVAPYILFHHGLSPLDRFALSMVWLIGLTFTLLTLFVLGWRHWLASIFSDADPT